MKNRHLAIGTCLLGLFAFVAIFADFIAPYDPLTQFRNDPLTPPLKIKSPQAETASLRFFVKGSPYRWLGMVPAQLHLFGVEEPSHVFLFGTDALGRDVFSRVVYGARFALILLTVVLSISLPLALTVGSLAGFYGGWIDFLSMRLVELLLALPALYLIIAFRAALPINLSLTQMLAALTAVIALLGWAQLARVVRGGTLALCQQGYIEAARSLGASDLRIVLGHLWPNLSGLVLTQTASAAPGFLLAEVTLSYLGLGIIDPWPSWGAMLSSIGGVYQLGTYWWNLAPGAAIWLVSFAFSSLAEGLRENFDLLSASVPESFTTPA